MSLVQNNASLYQNTLTSILSFYKNAVLPRLTQRNKNIGISVAIALSLAYYIQDRILKPPRNIRHIPYCGYFHMIKSLIIGRGTFFDRGYKYDVPYLNKPGNCELYSVSIILKGRKETDACLIHRFM